MARRGYGDAIRFTYGHYLGLAIDSGFIYTAWTNNRESDSHIYFSRSPIQ
jgi:hypothetical protein